MTRRKKVPVDRYAGLRGDAKRRALNGEGGSKDQAEADRLRREIKGAEMAAATKQKNAKQETAEKVAQLKEAEGPLSGLDACLKVLAEAERPMKAGEIADAVLERGLAPGLKGKTPKATLGAQVYTAAKAGKIRKTKAGFSIPS